MQEVMVSRLKSARLRTPQVHRNIVIFPMTDGEGEAVKYITLAEAMEGKQLSVTEVSEGGSVPELKVTNSAELPVLMLDGEEVAGAKQNRVLNTTVLVPAKQSIVIPVSCTEQGRWAYASDAFFDSGTVMASSIRARKNQSVSDSLAACASFMSNQGEVWEGISELSKAACAPPSPTSAMRDVFESQRESLDEAVKAFAIVPGQAGILVVIGGEAVGFDFVSRPVAYAHLHGKLLRSYVVDALAGRKKGGADAKAAAKTARVFLNRAMGCEEKKFKSVGCGEDYRFKGEHMAGSALVHSGMVIHAAFFHLDEASSEGHMSGLNRRRAYRMCQRKR